MCAVLVGWCVQPPPQLPKPPIEEYAVASVKPEAYEWSTTTVKELAIQVATENELPVKRFTDTIDCESGFTWNAYNASEDSAGAVQIHLPAHPDISKEQANDPEFAIRWMAEQWKEGNQDIWTCYGLTESGSGRK